MSKEKYSPNQIIKELVNIGKDIIQEPITYARELRQRLGDNSPFVFLPALIPVALGIAIGSNRGIVMGIIGGVASWVLIGAVLHLDRQNVRSIQ